jgi:patatin-like phospholipase
MSDASADHGPFPLSQVLAEECTALHGAQIHFPKTASEPERLTQAYTSIHQHAPTRSALCFSGGGIRSATFGHGVLQALARFNLIGQFDYLSTVSGGGYIGSWLSAWAHRESGGITAVCNQLGRTPQKTLAPTQSRSAGCVATATISAHDWDSCRRTPGRSSERISGISSSTGWS